MNLKAVAEYAWEVPQQEERANGLDQVNVPVVRDARELGPKSAQTFMDVPKNSHWSIKPWYPSSRSCSSILAFAVRVADDQWEAGQGGRHGPGAVHAEET